ncbi:hypothetical protein, partial [Streptomyces griseoruber]|uniref:hypothetical protein n=1 Tax=Streptomyces griseoruber TaxID=1943 RepID=UPI000A9F5397
PGAGAPGFAAGLDQERADAVLPVVRLLLGLGGTSAGTSDDNSAGTSDGNSDDSLAGVGR